MTRALPPQPPGCFSPGCRAPALFGFGPPATEAPAQPFDPLRACSTHCTDAQAIWARAYPRMAAALGVGVRETPEIPTIRPKPTTQPRQGVLL